MMTIRELINALSKHDENKLVLVDGTYCDRDILSVSLDTDGLPSYVVIEGTNEGMNNQ